MLKILGFSEIVLVASELSQRPSGSQRNSDPSRRNADPSQVNVDPSLGQCRPLPG